MLMRDYIFYL